MEVFGINITSWESIRDEVKAYCVHARELGRSVANEKTQLVHERNSTPPPPDEFIPRRVNEDRRRSSALKHSLGVHDGPSASSTKKDSSKVAPAEEDSGSARSETRGVKKEEGIRSYVRAVLAEFWNSTDPLPSQVGLVTARRVTRGMVLLSPSRRGSTETPSSDYGGAVRRIGDPKYYRRGEAEVAEEGAAARRREKKGSRRTEKRGGSGRRSRQDQETNGKSGAVEGRATQWTVRAPSCPVDSEKSQSGGLTSRGAQHRQSHVGAPPT